MLYPTELQPPRTRKNNGTERGWDGQQAGRGPVSKPLGPHPTEHSSTDRNGQEQTSPPSGFGPEPA
jgi:hypothetical protein